MSGSNNSQATIVKLKRQLADMQKSYAKSSELISSLGEAVVVTNEYGKIEIVNELCGQILGYKLNVLIGKRYLAVIKAVNEDGSLVEPMDRAITRAFLNGSAVTERACYLTSRNTAIPVAINVSPFIFNNVPIGAIEVFRDLTDEITREQIQSEFIALASHQLRTPLSAINTYAQMLSGGYAGKLNNRQTNFVSVIESSTLRMNELIHSLLNVTRLEAGSINVDIIPVDINELCAGVINSLTSLADDKAVDIKLEACPISDIDTDPVLLRELINNLIANSIKYTPHGGSVIVKVEIQDRVIISVCDNGFGIPELAKDYIFSKFYRAKNAVKHDVSGTGLGLYLAKQIADRLEGDIWFDSEVGVGTTFYFSLPVVGSAKKQGRFRLEAPKL